MTNPKGKRGERTLEIAERLLDATSAVSQVSTESGALLREVTTLVAAGQRVRPAAPFSAARDLLLSRQGAELQPLLLETLRVLADWPDGAPRTRNGRHGRDGAAADADRRELPPREPRAAVQLAVLYRVAARLNEMEEHGAQMVALIATERRAKVVLAGVEDRSTLDPLTALAPALADAFGVRLKLKVISTLAGRVPQVSLRYDQPLDEAGRAIVAAQRAALLAAEPGVRSGDDEAVHDLRVAVRRVRAVLRLLRRAYPRDRVQPLLRSLKDLTARVGAVRDMDVLLALVTADRHDMISATDVAATVDDWQRQRADARQALLDYLDGSGYQTVLAQLDHLLEVGASSKREEGRVCDAVPTLIQRRYGVVRAHEPRIATADLTELHEVRKDTKRLRYALEAFRPLLGAGSEELIAQLVALQDTLGSLHDAAVLSGRLEERLRDQDDPLAPGLTTLLDRTRIDLVVHRRTFEDLWTRLKKRRFRRQLGRVLAHL